MAGFTSSTTTTTTTPSSLPPQQALLPKKRSAFDFSSSDDDQLRFERPSLSAPAGPPPLKAPRVVSSASASVTVPSSVTPAQQQKETLSTDQTTDLYSLLTGPLLDLPPPGYVWGRNLADPDEEHELRFHRKAYPPTPYSWMLKDKPKDKRKPTGTTTTPVPLASALAQDSSSSSTMGTERDGAGGGVSSEAEAPNPFVAPKPLAPKPKPGRSLAPLEIPKKTTPGSKTAVAVAQPLQPQKLCGDPLRGAPSPQPRVYSLSPVFPASPPILVFTRKGRNPPSPAPATPPPRSNSLALDDDDD